LLNEESPEYAKCPMLYGVACFGFNYFTRSAANGQCLFNIIITPVDWQITGTYGWRVHKNAHSERTVQEPIINRGEQYNE